MIWSLQFTPWALPSLLAVLCTVRLLIYLWPRRRETGSLPLVVVMATAGWWSLFHLFAVININPVAQLSSARLGLPAGIIAPAAILWFALDYTRHGKHLWRPFFLLFSAASVVLAGMALWDFATMWSDPGLGNPDGPAEYMLARGYRFWVQAGLRLLAVSVSVGLLLRQTLRRREWLGVGAVVLAMGLGVIADVWHLLNPGAPVWFDLTPVGFALATVLLAVGLLRGRLLHVGPVARSLIVQRMREMVIVVDRKGQIVDLNQASEDLLGLETYGVVPVPLGTLWAAASARPDDNHRLDLVTTQAGNRTFEVTLTPMGPAEDPGRTIMVLRDITDGEQMKRALEAQTRELERVNIDLNRQAKTDGLTDLPNRRHFMEELDGEMARVSRYPRALSVILLDLDHFKEVNDTFGHASGDEVLVATAEVLRGLCRDSDTPGRLGGEEFGVLLPETSQEGARIMAERIRMGVERRLHPAPDGRSYKVTTSIGVATRTEDQTTGEKLLNAADVALYQAKEDGRNRVAVAVPG